MTVDWKASFIPIFISGGKVITREQGVKIGKSTFNVKVIILLLWATLIGERVPAEFVNVTDPELSTFSLRGEENVISPFCPRMSILPSAVKGNPTVSEVII